MKFKNSTYGVYLDGELVGEHEWISEAIQDKVNREGETGKKHLVNPIIRRSDR